MKVVQAFRGSSGPSKVKVELTQRECEILRLISQGYTDKRIADELGISYHTVKVHAKHIYEKLRIHSRSEAVMKYAFDKKFSGAVRMDG